MDLLKVHYVWEETENKLESMGLFGPVLQLFDQKDLSGFCARPRRDLILGSNAARSWHNPKQGAKAI